MHQSVYYRSWAFLTDMYEWLNFMLQSNRGEMKRLETIPGTLGQPLSSLALGREENRLYIFAWFTPNLPNIFIQFCHLDEWHGHCYRGKVSLQGACYLLRKSSWNKLETSLHQCLARCWKHRVNRAWCFAILHSWLWGIQPPGQYAVVCIEDKSDMGFLAMCCVK